MFYILAYDPGKTTGWAQFTDEPFTFKSGEVSFQEIGEQLDRLGGADLPIGKTAVVVENFTVTRATSMNHQAPWSLEVIGLLRYFALRNDLPFILQRPSNVKGLITDEVLRKAGVWDKGHPHARDALRHGLYYLMTELGKGKEFLR